MIDTLRCVSSGSNMASQGYDSWDCGGGSDWIVFAVRNAPTFPFVSPLKRKGSVCRMTSSVCRCMLSTTIEKSVTVFTPVALSLVVALSSIM